MTERKSDFGLHGDGLIHQRVEILHRHGGQDRVNGVLQLMVQFCTAYKSVLMKHTLFATATTGRLIADNTGLPITLLLSHKQGGHQQINARIAYNEIDLVLLFTDPNTIDPWDDSQMIETIRHCDKNNVPIATNLASAEMFIMGLQRGDLDWREMLHTKPRY